MAESALAASVNTIFKLIEFGLAYKEVSKDTQQLLTNIELTDRKLSAAKQLRRVKSFFLEASLKDEIDRDIEAAEQTVNFIGRTIEGCRVDLEMHHGHVRPLRKLKWLFRNNDAFRSQGWTLSNCLAALISDINRLDNINPPPSLVEPPSYEQATKFHGQLRSPTHRRRLAKQRSTSSLATQDMVSKRSADEHVLSQVQILDNYLDARARMEAENSWEKDMVSQAQAYDGYPDLKARMATKSNAWAHDDYLDVKAPVVAESNVWADDGYLDVRARMPTQNNSWGVISADTESQVNGKYRVNRPMAGRSWANEPWLNPSIHEEKIPVVEERYVPAMSHHSTHSDKIPVVEERYVPATKPGRLRSAYIQ
jgi:hypothetical protein